MEAACNELIRCSGNILFKLVKHILLLWDQEENLNFFENVECEIWKIELNHCHGPNYPMFKNGRYVQKALFFKLVKYINFFKKQFKSKPRYVPEKNYLKNYQNKNRFLLPPKKLKKWTKLPRSTLTKIIETNYNDNKKCL